MKKKHLLIDAKNLLYRVIYASSNHNRSNYAIKMTMKFMHKYYDCFSPDQVHVFWDSPRNETWRKKIYPGYKDSRNKKSPDKKDNHKNVNKMLNDLTESCYMLFKNMGIKQYYCDNMEADDLIYAFCKINEFDNIIIVSSDSDLKQISYTFDNVKIYNHSSKDGSFEDRPLINPVLLKCFVGDKSDNIDGYYKIGVVKAGLLLEDTDLRNEMLNSGKLRIKLDGEICYDNGERFRRNLQLIDLSLCPYLLDNIMYVIKRQKKKPKFDLNNLNKLISKYNLRIMTTEVLKYITPFKKLVEVNNGC